MRLNRNLPKRVVDLGLVDNGSKIIVADKFGDVFGFPLFPPASDSEPAVDETAVDSAPAAAASETLAADVEMATPEAAPGKAERVYQTEEQLLRHLEKQRAFAEKNRVAAERRKRLQVDYNISFTHEFVLGHVSMLLSLLTVTFPADHPLAAGKEKTWIITSDRDEHIRITRYPQTFVIEGFCLGHAQFVKTMLTPSWDLTTLISGGGDEYLLVWDWRQRRAIQKVDLVAPVQAVLGSDVKIYIPKSAAVKEKQTEEEAAAEEEKGQGAFKFAVSGLWEVPGVRGILVGIESVPALFLFTHTPEGLQYKSNLPLAGNFLDAAVNAADNKVFVSVDPASATDPLLGVYTVNEEGEWISDDKEIASNIERCVVSTVDVSEKLMAAVRTNVLYPVATLRKEYAVKEKEE